MEGKDMEGGERTDGEEEPDEGTGSDEGNEEDEEEEEEEDMPVLKYHRMRTHLSTVLHGSGCQVTALALHPRCLIVGTSKGYMHLLSTQGGGGSAEIAKVTVHKGHLVRAISIDESGEFVSACSDGGMVVVYTVSFPLSGLPPQAQASRAVAPPALPVTITQEQAFHFSDSLTCLAIDPAYRRKLEKSFVTGGKAGQVYLAQKGYFAYREDVLWPPPGEREGAVAALAWRGTLLAWGNDMGVKVMDVDSRKKITYVQRPAYPGPVEDVRCNLYWEKDHLLLIGWFDSVMLLEIKTMAGGRKIGSVMEWKVDCVISGLYPFDVESIAVLGYVTEEDEEEDEDDGERRQQPPVDRPSSSNLTDQEGRVRHRAELQLWDRHGGAAPFSAEILPLYGEERVRNSTGFLLGSSHTLGGKVTEYVLPRWRKGASGTSGWPPPPGSLTSPSSSAAGGGGYSPVLFVAAPEDLVVARVRDVEDVIGWEIRRGHFHAAIDLAVQSKQTLSPQKFKDLVTEYLEHLMSKGEYQQAAAECPRLLGDDVEQWEMWVDYFYSRRRLPLLAPYIPTKNPRLSPAKYEMVLHSFLDTDRKTFLTTLRAWHQPTANDKKHASSSKASAGASEQQLYSVKEIKDRVVGLLASNGPDVLLLEALAHIHIMDRRYEEALQCYWDLQDLGVSDRATFTPVFSLIEDHGLFDAVRNRALQLVRMDKESAADVLVRFVDQLPVPFIVRQLQPETPLLLWYLHTLFRRMPEQYNAPEYERFHVLQVELYASAAPAFRPVTPEEDDASGGVYESELLSFLTWSNYVKLETALAECERRVPPLYNEMVFILGRMAHNTRALDILLRKIGSVTRAIRFVEKHDTELWNDLIDYSLQNPVFLTGLLKHAGEYNVDLARELLGKIPDQMVIPGLKDKLVLIIQSYHFEVNKHHSCKKVTENDSLKSIRRLHHTQKRAVRIDSPSDPCQGCGGPLSEPPQPTQAVPAGEDGYAIFACRHAYHTACCLKAVPAGSRGAAPREVCAQCAKKLSSQRRPSRGVAQG